MTSRGSESVADSRTTRGKRDPSLLVIVAESRGVRSLVKLPRESGPQLEAMKEIVGGFLEAVMLHTKPPMLMFCNEDGHALDLDVNPFASLIAVARTPIVLGNVILTGPADDNGDITSLDQHWINTLI